MSQVYGSGGTAGALDYKGTWDCSTTAYPVGPAKGDLYICSVQGTIGGVLYKSGDWLVYDGSAWDKVNNNQSIAIPGSSGNLLANISNALSAVAASAWDSVNYILTLTARLVLSTITTQPAATYNGTTGLNDMTRNSAVRYLGSANKTFVVQIDANGTPDTFKWSADNGSTWVATGVAITGSWQTLQENIQIKFNATTTHTIGDSWSIAVTVNNPLEVQDAAGTEILGVDNNGVVRARHFETKLYAIGNSGSSLVIDPKNGDVQTLTLTDACTISFVEPDAGTTTTRMILKITQNTGSHYNITWTGVKWPGASIPTITATNGAVDIVSILLDGSDVYGVANQDLR